jgi:PiT family inorganic phosphate transporter
VTLTLVVIVLLVALVFEYINGFHDTANSIATVVATKVLSPGQAVLLAAATNLLGAMWGTAVAKTISSGLIDAGVVTMTPELLICALLGATIWDLITWWWGLPSSSSHALIGGLCGSAIAAASNNWNALIWSVPAEHWWLGKGLLNKVLLPMIVSPAAGFMLGFTIMGLLFALLSFLAGRGGRIQHWSRPRVVNAIFAKVQIVSSGFMGFSHGLNDAQKTMGIIALALAGATTAGSLDHLPGWLSFLRVSSDAHGQFEIATWIKATCAVVMASGTMVGGWRIIRTLGHKMVKLHPINGVAADMASSSVIVTASVLGIPVSTTHNVSAAIMGVGCAKRLNAIKWTVVERMVWAWILTLPICGGIAYLLVRGLMLAGLIVG